MLPTNCLTLNRRSLCMWAAPAFHIQVVICIVLQTYTNITPIWNQGVCSTGQLHTNWTSQILTSFGFDYMIFCCLFSHKQQCCPGIGWGSWYSAVCWILYENNVENALMLWLLLGCIYLKPRTFFVSHSLPVKRHTKRAGREHSWDRWHKLAKGIFYTMEC